MGTESSANHIPKAIIFGFAGETLTPDERAFFQKANPFGFILFARNCNTPAQVKALTADLRETVGRADAPILIDQEGGRVSRFHPPHWPKFAAARTFGEMYDRDPEEAKKLVYENGLMCGQTLYDVGISVNCAPCCDLFLPETTKAIGDRAYSASPQAVAALGRAMAEGLRAAGVLPVIKHMPGHGRARTDSHLQLPVVKTALEDLDKTDFVPFKELAELPLGMTAHAVFKAIDARLPASLSPTVHQDIIRERIGFKGFLFSDDIVMKALSDNRSMVALQSLFAGTDCILHCNGEMEEMALLAEAIPELTEEALKAWSAAKSWLPETPKTSHRRRSS